MIVVKIELWPLGDPKKAKLLGTMILTNDATGSKTNGNYDVALTHAPSFMPSRETVSQDPTKAVWRSGRVEGHKRSLSVYHLVLRGLRACGITFLKSGDDDEVFK